MQSPAATGLHTSFTGELIRRHHKTGQQYVQLVFKNGRHTKLALTGDLAMARSLRMNHTYKVGGREFTMGGKTYIRDPRTLPVASSNGRSKKLMLSAGAGAFCMVIIGGLLTMQVWAHSRHAQLTTDSSQQGQVKAVSTSTQSPSAPASTATNPNTGTTTTNNGTTASSTRRTSSSSSTTTNDSSANPTTNDTPTTPTVDPNPPVVDPNPPVVDPNPVDPNPVDPNPPVVDPNPPVDPPV